MKSRSPREAMTTPAPRRAPWPIVSAAASDGRSPQPRSMAGAGCVQPPFCSLFTISKTWPKSARFPQTMTANTKQSLRNTLLGFLGGLLWGWVGPRLFGPLVTTCAISGTLIGLLLLLVVDYHRWRRAARNLELRLGLPQR